MAQNRLRYVLGTVAIVAALPLAACGSGTSSTISATQPDASSTASQVSSAPKTVALETAGEPFEALTEQAFIANRPQLMSLYNDAENAAIGVRDKLSNRDAQALNQLLIKAKGAIDSAKPSEIALSAVEGYKIIVSAFPPDAKIPVEVSLLDYAGFRVQADLKTNPARWDDAKMAADYAAKQWSAIQGRAQDKSLNDKFSKSLKSLQETIAIKDMAAASTTASRELDLVDELENHFKSR